MSCILSEEQVQAWLDGESQHAAHALECPDCQARGLSVQKLRTRLTPPPSPLGPEFAARTARRILVRKQQPPGRPESPFLAIVRRQRVRQALRFPHLGGLFLLYALPALVLRQWGDEAAILAYSSTMVGALTLLLPLLLLSVEARTLTSLVRGQCLEEMLSTGASPRQLSDTLAWSSLKTMAPLLLVVSLMLAPLLGVESLWLLPSAGLFSWAGCYALQSLLLKAPQSGVLSVLAGLGAALVSWKMTLPGMLLLGVSGAWLRSRAVAQLERGGHLEKPTRTPAPAWQKWLAARLPEQAILQRELRRQSLIGPGWLLAHLLVVAVCWMKPRAIEPVFLPLGMMALAALQAGLSLAKEKASGSHDILIHSGITRADWAASQFWLSLLQAAPSLLLAPLCLLGWPLQKGDLTAWVWSGLVCAEVAALGFGALLATWSGWEGVGGDSRRRLVWQGLSALTQFLWWALLGGLVIPGLLRSGLGLEETLAQHSEMLFGRFGLTLALLLAIAGSLRSLRTRQQEMTSLAPLLLLIPVIPLGLLPQLARGLTSSTRSIDSLMWWIQLSLWLALSWAWLNRSQVRSWWQNTLSYLLCVIPSLYALAWLHYSCLQPDETVRLLMLAQVNWTGVVVAAVLVGGFTRGWCPSSPARPGLNLRLLTSLSCLWGLATLSLLSYFRPVAGGERVEAELARSLTQGHLFEIQSFGRRLDGFRGQGLLDLWDPRFQGQLRDYLASQEAADSAFQRFYLHLLGVLQKGEYTFGVGRGLVLAPVPHTTGQQRLDLLTLLVEMTPKVAASSDGHRHLTELRLVLLRELGPRLERQEHWQRLLELAQRLEALDERRQEFFLHRLRSRIGQVHPYHVKQGEVARVLWEQRARRALSALLVEGQMLDVSEGGLAVAYRPSDDHLARLLPIALELERIRLERGSYPESFQVSGLQTVYRSMGQDYRLVVPTMDCRLSSRGLVKW